MHRLMAAHSTHQAFEESGKTTKMTAGVTPDCETANLPARRFGRPPESAHPFLRGQPLVTEAQETIASVSRSNPEPPPLPPKIMDCFVAIARRKTGV
jgi:hypothetical protein